MREHAGREENKLPAACSGGDGLLKPCPQREAEDASELGWSALERECASAQLRCEIDVVELLKAEAHARKGGAHPLLSLRRSSGGNRSISVCRRLRRAALRKVLPGWVVTPALLAAAPSRVAGLTRVAPTASATG